ncbi:MAG TPA: AMP-binding protein [Noviherbaspirillum sp.]|uniref:AMP-binding protein n=1 Tax=Noviherbaspirillum sp. TaxID=1926288 RepID=UPI002B49D017|nr:AMP-binding protein [Noviherbaspirillum sp.]HJV84435.1 AMP-binding protein [Noviherbaspirillum sp.]
MEKNWLAQYPKDVPGEIALHDSDSLLLMMAATCVRFGPRAAFVNLDASLSFRDVERSSQAFAAFLQSGLGLKKGDRVAIMMPNLLQYPVSLFGTLLAGCTVVNVNPLYTARELKHQLIDSGAKAIVVLDNFAKTVEEVLPETKVEHVIVSRIGDLFHFPKAQLTNFVVKHVKHLVPEWHIERAIPFAHAIKEGLEMPLESVPVRAGDTAFLQYTGGTTGVPKGAVLTHGNLVANVRQTSAWVAGVLEEGHETAVIPLPLYHVFALTAMLTFFSLGATALLITNPRDIDAFVKELKNTRYSALIGVNTLFNALLNAPGAPEINAQGAKVVIAGGMAVQRGVAERWQRMFSHPIIEGYGLTEASPIVCANPLNSDDYTGCIGLPVPSTEVAIRDDDGNELPRGETGEICVRGPQVMAGYWNRPDETAHVLDADGWLRTGDLGAMDERGYIRLLDRKKDVIVVSGFKVFPNEVEDVVSMLPEVAECAAIAELDESGNESVRVVVVRKSPALTAEKILEHCRQNLTAYKVPRSVVFRDTPMPKSNIGKILRRVVRDEEHAGRTKPAEQAA